MVSYVGTQAPAPPPVYLHGTLAIGATLPPSVVLYPVPPNVYVPADGREYAYAIVNGQRVVVDSRTRVIIALAG